MAREIDPIEHYLDALASQFGARNPRELRSLLFEIDAHLRESVEHHVASGLTELDAKRQALRDLGPASELAQSEQRILRPSLSRLLMQFITTAFLLGCMAAVVIGASGIISEVANLIWGKSAVIGATSDHVFAAQDCARWIANDSAAMSCQQAALDDWIGEVVVYRVAVGILGVCGLAALWLFRRRVTYLPSIVLHTIGALGFAVTMLWTFALGLNGVISASGVGVWQWFSAAIATVFAAVYFGTQLVRDLRSSTWTNDSAIAQ